MPFIQGKPSMGWGGGQFPHTQKSILPEGFYAKLSFIELKEAMQMEIQI